MRIEVRLPKMGDDDSEQATVAYWLAKVGDAVQEGNDLLELTTDKAAFNVPSPVSGTLVEKAVAEDDIVSTNEVLCYIDDGK